MVWQAGRVVAAFSETVCMVLPPHVRPRAHGLVFGVRNGRLSRKAGGVNVRAFPSELFRTSSGKNRGQDIRRSMHQSCQSCKSCQKTAGSEFSVPHAHFYHFEHRKRCFCQPNHPRFAGYPDGHADDRRGRRAKRCRAGARRSQAASCASALLALGYSRSRRWRGKRCARFSTAILTGEIDGCEWVFDKALEM